MRKTTLGGLSILVNCTVCVILYVEVNAEIKEATLLIKTSFVVPDSITIKYGAYILHTKNFIASTSTNHVVKLTYKYSCYTYIGSSPASADCPFKSACGSSDRSLTNIIQIAHFSSYLNDVFILNQNELWQLNIVSCDMMLVTAFPSTFLPEFMLKSCSKALSVDIISENGVRVISLVSGDVLDHYQLPAFMSGHRISISNPECTRSLEVPFTSTLVDLRDYAWAGSQLLYLDRETQTLNLYRKLNQTSVAYWPVSFAAYKAGIQFISMVDNSGLMVLHSTERVLLIEERVWTVHQRATLRSVPLHTCTSVVIQHLINIDLETCVYKCIKNKQCQSLNYMQSKSCSLHFGTKTTSTTLETSICYIIN